MNINTATGRQAQDIVGQHNTICDDDDDLWCDFLESGIFFGKVFWLQDRKSLADCTAFDRTVNDFSSAPRRPIRLGIDRCDLVVSA